MVGVKKGRRPTGDYFAAVAAHIAAMPKPVAPPLDAAAVAAAKVLLETAPRLFRHPLPAMIYPGTAAAFSGPPIDPAWNTRLADAFAATVKPETRRAQN